MHASRDSASSESLAFLLVSHYKHSMCELMNSCILFWCSAHMITPCLQAYACVAHWRSFKAIFKTFGILALLYSVSCIYMWFTFFTIVKHQQSNHEPSHNIWSTVQIQFERFNWQPLGKITVNFKATFGALVCTNVEPQVSTIKGINCKIMSVNRYCTFIYIFVCFIYIWFWLSVAWIYRLD